MGAKEKPYNGGEWTTARMRSFVMSALRRAHWPQKYAALRAAFVESGVNPKTGRKCKLHRCTETQELLPANQMHVDHVEPVVPLDGKWGKSTEWLGYNWNELLPRLFCELDNLEAISKEAHKIKSAEERKKRKK